MSHQSIPVNRHCCLLPFRFSLVLFLLSATTLAGCKPDPDPQVKAFAEGTLTIRPQADSTQDYSGFEVLLVTQVEGDVDTLGMAVTASDGAFSMNITASEEGIYPLVISRVGAMLAFEEFVVVDGDSTRVSGAFPLMGRRI